MRSTPSKDNQGKYQTISNIPFKGPRGKKQLVHRELSYLAMRVSMDRGIRLGSMRKLKWKDISENTTIPKEERKIWVNIDVSPENSKTGRLSSSLRVAGGGNVHTSSLYGLRYLCHFYVKRELGT